jgi:alkylated DNA repair protein alkB homolog 6
MNSVDIYKIEKCPMTAFYIPNFIDQQCENDLIRKIYDVPKPKWTTLKNRRLQNWGGLPDNDKGMIQEEIPQWLNIQCSKITQLGFFNTNIEHGKDTKKPNHILVNEYQPGQGIMPHEDGPLYYPTITTISLGCHTVLDFYKPILDTDNDENIDINKRYAFSFFVEPRSLLVLKDKMYTQYLHGIKETNKDFINDTSLIMNFNELSTEYKNLIETSQIERDNTRISLTIRHVPKVVKTNINSLFSKLIKK